MIESDALVFFNSFFDDELVDSILRMTYSFFEKSYSTELKNVSDATKMDIFEQRFPTLLREMKLMEDVNKIACRELGLQTRLNTLDQLEQMRLSLIARVNNLTISTHKLQVDLFGRIVYPLTDDVIDLVNEPSLIDIEVIKEKITAFPDTCSPSSWRPVTPSELLAGLKVDDNQRVIYENWDGIWDYGIVQSSSSVRADEPSNYNNLVYTIISEAELASSPEVVQPDIIASTHSSTVVFQKYSVGTRVVAEFPGQTDRRKRFKAGIVADPPSIGNKERYLIFFDDASIAYCPPDHVYRICKQMKTNYTKSHHSMVDFVVEYLKEYPESPMARLKVGDTKRVKRDQVWLDATVSEVDCKIARLEWSDNVSEWLFRGSTRLFDVYQARIQAQRIKEAGGQPSKSTATRLLRQLEDGPPKPVNTDRRTLLAARPKPITKIPKSMETAGQIVPYLHEVCQSSKPATFTQHVCSSECVQQPAGQRAPRYSDYSTAELPLRLGWKRLLHEPFRRGRVIDTLTSNIVYVAPCGRRLQSASQLARFLSQTNADLRMANFVFDPNFLIDREFRPMKTAAYIRDLSYGKEAYPITCINTIDHEYPTYVDYTANRFLVGAMPETALSSKGFRVCCDCKNNCRDKKRCPCQQLTVEASALRSPQNIKSLSAGYHRGRLLDFHPAGIYECNSSCACNRTCNNRVVQHGLVERLQVFKTIKKGWGIRAVRPIPKGSFLSLYAGAMFDDVVAEKEGLAHGDEYQANLDYIEIVEEPKEDYEETAASYTDDELESVTSEQAPGKMVSETGNSSPTTPESSMRRQTSRKNGCGNNSSPFVVEDPVEGKLVQFTDPEVVVDASSVFHKKEEKDAAASTGGDEAAQSGAQVMEQDEDVVVENEHNQTLGFRRSTGGGIRHTSCRLVPRCRRHWLPARKYFNEEDPYVMDAKKTGNLARYFNHSCNPNAFVQSVFVETQDPRFPEVAFFAKKNIDAGEELTWDYGYSVGSVESKELFCYCGAPNCRIRLL